MRGYPDTFVLLDEAVDLDAENRRVVLAHEAPIEYTHLIVATGATDSYFGHDDWRAFAPGLKSIEGATEVRHKILYAFEAAEREPDPDQRRAWLTFVVVGAGPTSVELAGALSEIARDTLRQDFRLFRSQEARILLLDTSPLVLPTYPADLSEQAARQLIRLGVRPRNNVQVIAVDAEGVTLRTHDGEERLATRTVLWAAGVKPSAFGKVLEQRAGAKMDRRGQKWWHRIVDRRSSRDIRNRRYGFSGAGRQAAPGSSAGGDAGGPVCGGSDSRAGGRKNGSAVSISRQGEPGGDRTCGGVGRFRTAALSRLAGVAAVAVRSPDVSGAISQSRAGVYTLGISVLEF